MLLADHGVLGGAEFLELGAFAFEGADDADAAVHIGEAAGENGAVVLDVSPHGAEAFEEEHVDENDGGDEEGDEEGEFPVGEVEDGDDAEDAEEGGVGDDHGVVDAADDLVDVGHDAGDDAAGFVIGEEGEGEADEMVVEALAEGAGEAVVDALGGEEFDPVEDDGDGGDNDHDPGEEGEGAPGVVGEDGSQGLEEWDLVEAFAGGGVIDEEFEDVGHEHGGEGGAGDAGEEGGEGLEVALEHEAVFGDELGFFLFEFVGGAAGTVFAAGIGGGFAFDIGV